MTVAVLGVHGGRVPPGTEPLLDRATLVVGGTAQLEALAPPHARTLAVQDGLGAALDALAAEEGPACVLASGDPGFFGIARALGARLGAGRLALHPAPSSVAVAFARLGLPWDDALVVSGHGRAPHAALAALLRHPKVAVLTDPAAPPSWYLAQLGERRVAIASRLGEPDEQVVAGRAGELAGTDLPEPCVLLGLPEDGAARATVWPPRTPPGWALPEDAFEHRAGMVTKREVRALALARLGPGVGDLVWDVGCGSGSVGIEAARLGAAVVALDHDPEAVELTRRNAATHGVALRALAGRAPAALAALPDPDAVFVGGGGADLLAILDACAARARRAVVCSLALIERAGPAIDRLSAAGLETDATLLQASRLRPLAGGHRLAAENPIVVVSGVRP